MNIKEEGKKIHLLSAIFGGDKDNDLFMWVLGSTFGFWFAAIIVGSIVFLMNGTQMVYLEVIINALMIGTIAGFGVTIASVMGSNDYNSHYGWSMWWRSIIYNIIAFGIFYSINHGVTNDKHREVVNSFELITSDIKDCEYMIKMESATLVYNHCSSYDHTYKKIEQNNDVNAYLIGQTSYGTNKASHFEIVNKKIIRKAK